MTDEMARQEMKHKTTQKNALAAPTISCFPPLLRVAVLRKPLVRLRRLSSRQLTRSLSPPLPPSLKATAYLACYRRHELSAEVERLGEDSRDALALLVRLADNDNRGTGRAATTETTAKYKVKTGRTVNHINKKGKANLSQLLFLAKYGTAAGEKRE